MPNWCENDLTVRGPVGDVEAFLTLMKGESLFDFGKVILYPEEFRRLDDLADGCVRRVKGGADFANLDDVSHGGDFESEIEGHLLADLEAQGLGQGSKSGGFYF